MDYEDAFWRVVDVANLERRVDEAKDAADRVDDKIAKAKAHLDEAKAAKDRAREAVQAAEQALAAAQMRAAEIPDELAAQAQADVGHRNLIRDTVIQSTAGLASASAEANGGN